MVETYLIAKSEISEEWVEQVILDFPENEHFASAKVPAAQLLTIYSDIGKDELSNLLRVNVNKLQLVSDKRRRAKKAEYALFLLEEAEITEDSVGKEVFQSYKKILPKFNVDELEESNPSTETTMSNSPREFMVPEWASGEDIEKYITKLELAKEMSLFENDKLLIFYSLTRSKR